MSELEEANLPEGVELRDGPREVIRHGLSVIEVEYRMHGLGLVIGWTVNPPEYFMAPDRLEISPDEPLIEFMNGPDPELNAASRQMYNGVTKPFLRSIPMAHARQLLRGPYEQLSVRLVRDQFTPMPLRIESDEDYMHVACAYVDLVTGPSAEPIRRLAEWTDVKPATWSARLQRARTKGLLVGKGRNAHISPDFKKLERDVRERCSRETRDERLERTTGKD